MSDIRDQITAILARHIDRQLTNYDYDNGREECGCGKQGPLSWREHIADVLVTELGLHQETKQLEDGHSGLTINYTRWVSGWSKA